MTETVTVWESYENNGNRCCAFLTKELAESHTLFEIGSVTECIIYLPADLVKELKEGRPAWL
jgi:hypothetical protein